MWAKWQSLGALALTLSFFATPTSAAPIGNVSGVQAGTSEAAIDLVSNRRCWWADGRRHCRRSVARYYGYDDGYYGYGPGIGLYFGRRDGHRHGHGRGHR